MQCPVCAETQLVMSDRQGIEIDYCPKCRGVWLDRGELDKIIDRSTPDVPDARAPAAAPQAAQPAAQPQYQPPPQNTHAQPHSQRRDDDGYRYDDRARNDPYNNNGGGYYKKKKREGFLSQIFDFD